MPRTWRTVPSREELADDQGTLQAAGKQLVGGEQHTESDGQVVGRAFLAHGGRDQVDDRAPARERLPGVLDRHLDTLAALLHCGVGQAGDGDAGQAVTGVMN